MKPESSNISDYLKSSKYINYEDPAVRETAKSIIKNCRTKEEKVKCLYEFVRDEIGHSWDIQNRKVTISASEVLEYQHGLCYAKSNLLAALLRSQGIPTGICYQRITLGDTPDTGYVIHALNAVYFEEINKWIRLDARGNKEGVKAQFSMEKEQLAFPIRKEYGETDYEVIYTHPAAITMTSLENSTDVLEFYQHHLPTQLEIF